jgi:hypothetical protein
LGLINNPFTLLPGEPDGPDMAAITIETHSAANELLNVLDSAASQPSPRTLWIEKSSGIPGAYPMRAISKVENVLATDDDLDILHAYVQLYLMRTGRVRATLGVVGERLAFRSFDRTLAAWVERVLKTPDTELASYQLLGPDGLARFAAAFAEEPLVALAQSFGEPELERQLDLAHVADRRFGDLTSDVEEDESTQEVDGSVGVALGVVPLEAEPDKPAANEPDLVADYLIEYAKVHLSPVVARALRTYKARGIAAMSLEFRITKAPRKTLRAVVEFARCRYRKLAIIYDGFEGWINVPDELREQIVTSLGEIRDMLSGDAFLVVMVEQGAAPELEAAFGNDERLTWSFSNLQTLEQNRDVLDLKVVDEWLARAARPGGSALSSSDPVLAALTEAAEGSMWKFATMAAAAVEDAAERGVSALDETAKDAGLAAKPEEVA